MTYDNINYLLKINKINNEICVAHIPVYEEDYLEDIWRRFNTRPIERLTQVITQQDLYQDALKNGEWEELDFNKIVSGFQKKNGEQAENIRTADGRNVQKWVPQKAKRRPANS